jgi:isochorismate synthase EntC
MDQTQSALSKWLDQDFFTNGAFLTSVDGETITLAKGGEVKPVNKFLDSTKPIFYLKDFYQDSFLSYAPATILECTRGEIEAYLEELDIQKSHFTPVENDDDLYQKDFNNLKSAFKQNLEKVVLVSRETYGEFEGEKTIKRLFKKAFEFGAGIPYGFWEKHYGVIGSTPELLFEVDFDELKTFALAGTARLGEEKQLLNSAKDRHEHNVVIQDIKEKLEDFSSEIEIEETKVEPFKNIVHLKTDIAAIVEEDINLTELTKTLSPTAALGGYPKNSSLTFLKSSQYSQKYPQRYFGSGFGLISEDLKEFVVSIRNVQWENQKLFIESGGGVVSESEFDKELEEIHLKRQTIKNHYL